MNSVEKETCVAISAKFKGHMEHKNFSENLNEHRTVQCSTVQFSTVQFSTVQYSTVQYSTVQYSISLQNNFIIHIRSNISNLRLILYITFNPNYLI